MVQFIWALETNIYKLMYKYMKNEIYGISFIF